MSNLLFIGTQEDVPYLSYLKSCAGSASIAASCVPVSTLAEVTTVAKKRFFSGVLTTSTVLLKKLVGNSNMSISEASIANYAGSYFERDGLPIVILNPLAQLITIPYGSFLAKRFITKLSAPENWLDVSTFNWRVLTASNAEEWYHKFEDAWLIACDIETVKEPTLKITCIGYTAVFKDGTSASVVLPIDSMFAVSWMRKFNALPAAKIFQNGKYDNSYLLRYNAPITNWMWDTANLFHSWYSELPKNLGFLNAFFVRKAAYWKDMANTGNLHDYYMYNALDTWATANAMLAALNEMPQWALDNYSIEFPLNFPCLLSEMTGIARDFEALDEAAKKQEEIITSIGKSLDTMLGVKNFNVGSPKQKKQLLTILGCSDIATKSTDEKSLKKASRRHPLNARILGQVTKVVKARKLKSTYLTVGKEFLGRILFSLNPHATDTTRLASSEHHFWCGLNIQNIPRGKIVKATAIADEDFLIAEVDLEQAESRDTAYIAGEERLIEAVTGERDFHSVNTAAFFGVSYDSIFDEAVKKVKDVERRDLGKKVNHGANYNMGAEVMVDTLGEEILYRAGILLGLPLRYSAKQIAQWLLDVFHRTYPGLGKIYYPAIVHEVVTSHMITSHAIHDVPYQATPAGLVRYCFGDPIKNKRNLNAYIAHPPQSLNARTLNKAYMRIFYEIAIHPEHSKNFKLIAQIHDSILFQFRIGHNYLCQMVKERMEIPIIIRGYDEKSRTFTVPAAIKAGKDGQGVRSWADI